VLAPATTFVSPCEPDETVREEEELAYVGGAALDLALAQRTTAYERSPWGYELERQVRCRTLEGEQRECLRVRVQRRVEGLCYCGGVSVRDVLSEEVFTLG